MRRIALAIMAARTAIPAMRSPYPKGTINRRKLNGKSVAPNALVRAKWRNEEVIK